MFGAIIGDVIGSVYEWVRTKRTDFKLFCPKTDFTDDTVLTVATADALMHDGDYGMAYKKYALDHSGRGFGGMFYQWMKSAQLEPPYNSFGNGSAMRVSPIGWAFNDLQETLAEAKKSAECTHNHPEGIKGAQATVAAMFLARTKRSKADIQEYITVKFGYDLSRTVDEIRPTYSFNETCQQTVPQAIRAFIDSTDYENAIRLAISLGGDSDTLACITGGIAEAFYKDIPEEMCATVIKLLPDDFVQVMQVFYDKYGIGLELSA